MAFYILSNVMSSCMTETNFSILFNQLVPYIPMPHCFPLRQTLLLNVLKRWYQNWRNFILNATRTNSPIIQEKCDNMYIIYAAIFFVGVWWQLQHILLQSHYYWLGVPMPLHICHCFFFRGVGWGGVRGLCCSLWRDFFWNKYRQHNHKFDVASEPLPDQWLHTLCW